jgi:hypothetical protein
MGLIGGIVLIVCGLLCVPSLLAQKSPQAAEQMKKLAPFQGWIGLIVAAWGAWGVINGILTLGWLASWPLWWATNLSGNVLCLFLGIILGYGMIQQFALAKANDAAKAKAEEFYKKLVGMQSTLGIVGIILGLWVLLYNIVLQGIFLI